MIDIKINYLNNSISKIEPNPDTNWIDLRASQTIKLKKNEITNIPLGFQIEIPSGYEAHIIPRKTSFTKYGFLLTTGIHVVTKNDTSEIFISVLPTKDATINFNDRIFQMKIEKNLTDINYIY